MGENVNIYLMILRENIGIAYDILGKNQGR